jgi:hypothetical protein
MSSQKNIVPAGAEDLAEDDPATTSGHIQTPGTDENQRRTKWLCRLGLIVPYAAILLLQLRMISNIWSWDLSGFDTSCYFLGAARWHQFGKGLDSSFYPLYQMFLGSMLFIKNDPVFACVMHRVLILSALSVSILALYRRLFPPTIAWLVTAWWVIQSVDYGATVEIHLFGFFFAVIACLIAGRKSSLARGLALAWLAIGGILVRSEMIMAFAALAGCTLYQEVLQSRLQGTVEWRRIASSYGLPLALSACFIVWFFNAFATEGPDFLTGIDSRQRQFQSQMYALSYVERHPDDKPWRWMIQSSHYVNLSFHRPFISCWQGMMDNPREMISFFAFNAKLVPSAIQLLLFDDYFGSTCPDVRLLEHHGKSQVLALILAVASLVSLSLAIFKSVKCRDFRWLKNGGWTAIALACTALPSLVVMISGRPRPEYLYPLGLLLRWLIAAGIIFCAARWWNTWNFRFGKMIFVVFAACLFIMPIRSQNGFLPRRVYYTLLQPFEAQLLECQLNHKKVIWPLPASGPYPFELSSWLTVQPILNYLLNTHRNLLCDSNCGTNRVFCAEIHWADLRGPEADSIDTVISHTTAGRKLSDELVKANAQMIMINQQYALVPQVAEFMRNAPENGWNSLSVQGIGPERLWLYFRPFRALGQNQSGGI